MIDKFLKKINLTSKQLVDDDKVFYKDLPLDLFNLLDLFGGVTFGNGLYRIHSFKSSLRWSLMIADYFKKYENKIYPFGFDWMGRQFCLSKKGDLIFMFDPATGEDFEMKQSLILLHEYDFVDDTDSMLAIDLFNKVLKNENLQSVDYSKCLGYKTPLFLGGKDELSNYELTDLEVYWHIQTQLLDQVKNLPEGTKIGNIKFEK